jgi:hypothetical protein
MMMVEMWWHMPIDSMIKRRPNTTHVKGSALQLFRMCFHLDVIFMVAQLFWLLITNIQIFDGVRSTHRKVNYCILEEI